MEEPFIVKKLGRLQDAAEEKQVPITNGLKVRLRIQRLGGFTGDQIQALEEPKPMEFIMGEKHFIKGFEMALPQLCSGEIAEIGVRADHAYG